MKTSSACAICMALFLSAFGAAASELSLTENSTAGQSIKAEAMKWFNIAAKERTVQKKIEAYQAALKIEPTFVEALYNLGLVFKGENDFAQAEIYFGRAEKAFNFRGRNDLKMKIVYELAQAYRRQNKLPQTQDALLRALNVANDKNTRATISLELARTFFSSSQYRLALETVEKSIAEKPKNEAFLRNYAATVTRAMQIEALYDSASTALAAREFDDAVALLEQIHQTDPTYKDVSEKLQTIGQELAAKTHHDKIEQLYNEGLGFEKQGRFEQAVARFEAVLRQSPGHQNAAKRLTQAKKTLANTAAKAARLESRKEELYEKGLVAFQGGEWEAAISAFKNVASLDPSFRNVQRKLKDSRANAKLTASSNLAAQHYTEGLAALNDNQPVQALEALQKVHAIDPNYRNIGELLSRTRQLHEAENRHSSAPQAASAHRVESSELDALYEHALEALDSNELVTALTALEKLRLLAGSYRNVDDLISATRQRLGVNIPTANHALAEEASNNESLQPFVLGGIVLSLLVFPVLGFLAFSPAIRAKLLLAKGNNQAALRIYERIIAKNPDRLKYYPMLASLYLLAGKRDARAMKVYKTVLENNLAAAQKENIQTFVAQNFLIEEATVSSDAIDVLENALRDEKERS